MSRPGANNEIKEEKFLHHAQKIFKFVNKNFVKPCLMTRFFKLFCTNASCKSYNASA